MGINRLCVSCGKELTAARLAAMPDAVQCVPCLQENGDVARVQGHMVWDHKTAPTIEIGTSLATNKPKAHPREGKNAIGLTSVDFDSPLAEGAFAINTRAARCHSERPAVAKGLCVSCALKWYEVHRC